MYLGGNRRWVPLITKTCTDRLKFTGNVNTPLQYEAVRLV